MATNIFLGLPPPNIVKWIRDNYKPDMTKVPIHFTANEDNSSVSLVCFDEGVYDFLDSWCKLDYSMDGKSWQAYIDPDSDDETLHRGKVISLSKGETVYFKATLGDAEGNPNLDGFSRRDGYVYHYFVMEGSIKADGNIQFLLDSTGEKMDIPGYCYYNMFHGCTSLTQAPALPAETLDTAMHCYTGMFNGCTFLTKSPDLPSTILTFGCYSYMFSGCTSLTHAPALPATTLAAECYDNMFSGCTSLTHAPALPATTLVNVCYNSMFSGCTSLNNINVNFTAWDPSYATYDWVTSVSSSGTFTCPAGLPEEFGSNRIPTGWTVVRK